MPGFYVDNASNRRLGRVGMPRGSMPVSRSGGGGGGYYVDNSMNRGLGRVGMPHGSMPHSRNGASGGYSDILASLISGVPTPSPTYDTDSLSVGKTHDTQKDTAGVKKMNAPSDALPKSDHSGVERSRGKSSPAKPADTSSSPTNTKTYVDNAFNARHGRVGLPLGTAKLTKSSTPKEYVDNLANRSMNRVGKLVGEAVFSKKTNCIRRESYVDNSLNRQLERVGLPRGSRPITRKSSTTKQISKMVDLLAKTNHQEDDHDYRLSSNNDVYGLAPLDDLYDDSGAYGIAKCQYNRMNEEHAWMISHQSTESPKTSTSVMDIDTGIVIPYSALSLGAKIGQGWFGDVYYGEWRESVVAVKKLKTQNFSKRELKSFESEMMMLCELDHPTIIKLIGVCVEIPDVCIVMEYMSMSLFDAIHVSNTFDFAESNRLDIICQVCDGLYYLHSKGIAHSNLKTTNVLMECSDDGEDFAIKLTNFGISMMRSNVQRATPTTASRNMTSQQIVTADTIRYSAPEVLRGDFLKVEEMMMADVYSLALVLFEIIYEAEPYYDLSYMQILKLVGETGITPEVPEIPNVARGVKEMMQKAWRFSPVHRPTVLQVLHKCSSRDQLYFDRISQ